MDNHLLQFLHNINDGGLHFLNRYLEEKCHCSVFHISPSRRLIYNGKDIDRCQQLKKKICAAPMKNEFLYNKEDRYMVYQFTINEARQQLVFSRWMRSSAHRFSMN